MKRQIIWRHYPTAFHIGEVITIKLTLKPAPGKGRALKSHEARYRLLLNEHVWGPYQAGGDGPAKAKADELLNMYVRFAVRGGRIDNHAKHLGAAIRASNEEVYIQNMPRPVAEAIMRGVSAMRHATLSEMVATYDINIPISTLGQQTIRAIDLLNRWNKAHPEEEMLPDFNPAPF